MNTNSGTFRELIMDLGGVTAFARGMGIDTNSAKMMRDRNSVSPKHWPDLIRVCAAHGRHITVDDLVEMRKAKRGVAA